MVGAMKNSYFLISFFLQSVLYVRIHSILKVMCIFSRCELFIIVFVQELCKLGIIEIFLDCIITLVHTCFFKDYCMISVMG